MFSRFGGLKAATAALGTRRWLITSTTPAPGTPFHLAIPVHDLALARHFYGTVLGLEEGRRDETKWQDYSIGGHQLVCHYVGPNYRALDFWNPVDKDDVPVPHFGLALSSPEFNRIVDRLAKQSIKFIIPPTLRFSGEAGEQMTCFFKDPSGNSIEFKAMTNPEWLFKRYDVNKPLSK